MSYNPGDVLKDRYVIQEILGQGAMGEVYRAEHVTIHRQFAIKLMHVHIAEKSDALTRFRREASAAAQLEHPHICQVTDFDSTENGDFYLVMEYLKGETLKDRIKRNGTIDLHSIFHIMDDLLCALECAHSNGIVHRDVKPENIVLINRDERNDYVKLIDFGIAHAEKPDDNKGTLTQAGQVYGTPQYLSPEQVLGEHVDFRADLYSCGCTLFEMIEGVPPFEADNYILLLNKHLTLQPPHLTKEFDCAGELDEVLQKLLKKQPQDRYNTAREVRIALAAIAKRFEPTLNLYMSQNGGTSPSVSSHQDTADTLSDSKNGQIVSSKIGMFSITNPYFDPNDMGKTQNGNTNTAEDSDNTEKKAGNFSKISVITIAIAVGIIAILLLAFLYILLGQNNKANTQLSKQSDSGDAMDVLYPQEPSLAQPSLAQPSLAPKQEESDPELDQRIMDINDTEVISDLDPNGYILTDEQLREFAQTECRISKDDPLYKDKLMRSAIDNCAKGNFEEAYQVFDQYKNKYKTNERFFIMSLLNSYAVKRYRDAIRDALQLVVIDPAAVCTPAVREIIYSLYEDDVTYPRLRTGFLNLFDQPGTAEGLSWLLLLTPCNQHQKRFERLSDSIKVSTNSFEEKYNETWLGMAVHIWDDFNPKSQCTIGKSVDKIVIKELKAECEGADDAVANSGRCSMCYPIWQNK